MYVCLQLTGTEIRTPTLFGPAGNGRYITVVQRTYLTKFLPQAITEMTRQLRQGKGRNGLILANGGWVTYQHVICLSTMRRRGGAAYPDKAPLPDRLTDVPVPPVDVKVEGEQDAVIEVSACCPRTLGLSNFALLAHSNVFALPGLT